MLGQFVDIQLQYLLLPFNLLKSFAHTNLLSLEWTILLDARRWISVLEIDLD